MNDKINRYLNWKWLVAAACIIILAILLTVKVSSSGEQKNSGQEDTPGKTLSDFYSALVSGAWDEARAMCDSTGSARAYVDSFAFRAREYREKESGAMEIASGMIGVQTTGKRKDKTGTEIDFRLSLEAQRNGAQKDSITPAVKEKTARLKMEENGKWMIADITSR